MKKAFISPSKYIQNLGALSQLGQYIKLYGDEAYLIAHKDDAKRVENQLKETQKTYGVTIHLGSFKGECTWKEVERLKKDMAKTNSACVIGLGGGKALDTAKCVSNNNKPVIVCPTIAATDAPTSSSAVVYKEDGSFDEYAYFTSNPNIVLVDTDVIAKAPTRFLVAGMGDALSTYFEARACRRAGARVNASGFNQPKAIGTNTAFALAQLCLETLYEDGLKAKIACDNNKCTKALENIVETNILLSGLGFESGGLAAAHAVYNGMTAFSSGHNYFHGEKVAFGTLVQLVLENADQDELDQVLNFCLTVGLPVCLADMEIIDPSDEEIRMVAEKACIPEESIHNMPFPITVDEVVAAIKVADSLGSDLKYGQSCCDC